MIVAIVAFAGVIIASGRSSAGGTTAIVVAAHDIQLRTEISAADLQLVPYSSANLPPGAYTATSAVVGKIAAVDFSAGQPILSNLVSSSATTIVGSATSYLPIPAGWVAVTIPSGEQQAVAGYIQPGDYISVIATVTPQGSRYPEARTVFTNLHVIRVGPAVADATGSVSGTVGTAHAAGVSSSLTVVVSQCDAEYLNWFLTYASLKYTLESYKDYKPAPAAPAAACPAVTSANGVTGSDVQKRWPGLLSP
ncbi:MAG TPA: Flp pilus assembly protein CpaB [Candidatus Dormibacteraeota bacterium]